MKILFLEDDENRIAKARQGFVGHELHLAWTAESAIKLLAKLPFDLASLDHDLGGTQMGPSDDNSGYAVAKFIADMPRGQRPAVIVHSFNPNGAENMVKCLGGMAGNCVRVLFDTLDYWQVMKQAAMQHEAQNLDGFDDLELLGKTLDEAGVHSSQFGYTVRAVRFNGAPAICTRDVKANRINVWVADGVIVKIDGTG
jgi:hypothetical protein